MKSIRDKLAKFGLSNKKMNKENYTLLKNIELICLIDINKVNEYKKFLIDTLSKKDKYKKLINYLKNFWFKKDNEIYNFSLFFSKYKNDKNAVNKIYLTNNIVESLHGKLNYYLPKHTSNQYNFINSLNNVFVNDAINNNNIIRHDYSTKSLLLLIEKEKINEEFKWITFEKFKYYLNLAIKNENTDYEKNDIENFIIAIEKDLNMENSFLEDNNDIDETNHKISKK